MSQKELNLGILAHVDAGKTTLTERLLYEAGAISAVGSVDRGTTQTDSLALERQRGITIRAAVASFALGEVHVNLIDTPGHPDFIAEVERVLDVLDGAVLVVSAVEGVQPQTRILMRALERLEVPTLLFVNKIDRMGARPEEVVTSIGQRLTPAIVQMGSAENAGERNASFTQFDGGDARLSMLSEVLSKQDDDLLALVVERPEEVTSGRLEHELARQSRLGKVHPLFMGSAATGAGVEELMKAIPDLLPTSGGDPDGALAGQVFKIERGPGGEKVAFIRLFDGQLHVRDQLTFAPDRANKVKAIDVFNRGSATPSDTFSAGQVAKIWGLASAQVGDRFGDLKSADADSYRFPPPTLEAVISPKEGADRTRLLDALAQLAEQDPLINVRQDDAHDEISVSLYGEVQKEVIEATLATDYGLEVVFREATTICVERPSGTGEAVEVLYAKTKTNVTGKSSPLSDNPFLATLALRVEPAPPGSGMRLDITADVKLRPLYVYKSMEMFQQQMSSYVREALTEGLYGWNVTDCHVTIVDCGYRAPGTVAADFRKLTPIVLFEALERAGTRVCEPVLTIRVETPAATTSAVMGAIVSLGGRAPTPSEIGVMTTIEATLPAGRLSDLQRRLPSLSGGEATVASEFAGYEPAAGEPATRRRLTANPLNRQEYMKSLELGTGA